MNESIKSMINDYPQGWISQKELHRPSKRSPRSTSRTRTWWWSVVVTLLPNRPWPGTRTPRSWCRGPATRCAPLTKEMTTLFTLIFWWEWRYLDRNYPYAYFRWLNFDILNWPGFAEKWDIKRFAISGFNCTLKWWSVFPKPLSRHP